MKTETNRKLWQRNRPILCATSLPLTVGSALMIGFMPWAVLAGPINGTITGQTTTANVGDDSLTSTIIDISYFTSCYFITADINSGGFGAHNFVFAGQGVASGPFYNQVGASGTGTVNRRGTIPLVTSPTVAGWLVDIPNIPEWGYLNEGTTRSSARPIRFRPSSRQKK